MCCFFIFLQVSILTSYRILFGQYFNLLFLKNSHSLDLFETCSEIGKSYFLHFQTKFCFNFNETLNLNLSWVKRGKDLNFNILKKSTLILLFDLKLWVFFISNFEKNINELSLCHKLWFSNLLIFATQSGRP